MVFTDQPTVVFTSVGGRHDSSIISSYLPLLLLLVVTYDKKHPNLEKRGKNLNTFSDEVETICNLSKKHQLRETIFQCIVPGGMSFDGLKIHHRIYYLVISCCSSRLQQRKFSLFVQIFATLCTPYKSTVRLKKTWNWIMLQVTQKEIPSQIIISMIHILSAVICLPGLHKTCL